MRYTLVSRRKSVKVKSNSDFITWMRKNDSQPWKCNLLFMEGYSYRKVTFEQISIDYQNEDEFVQSLVKNNLLKIAATKRWFFSLVA